MGYYSETPISVTFNVLMPPSYAEVASTTANFSTGTHVGTERYDDDNTYGQVLRVDRGDVNNWTESGNTLGNPQNLFEYRGKLYTSRFTGGDIYVLNDEVWSKSGDVGAAPFGMAVFEDKLYVACSGPDEIWVFDENSWIKSGDVGGGPKKLAVFNSKLYVTCESDDEVWVFDGSSWTKSGDTASNPYAICEFDGKLYVSCLVMGTSEIYVFNGSVWSKSGDVGTFPYDLVEFNSKLYTACYLSNDIYEFNGSAWSKSTDLTGEGPIALCVYENVMYIAGYTTGNIYMFDGNVWPLLGNVGAQPTELVSFAGGLYVTTNVDSGTIYYYVNNLSGYWESPEIDLSADTKARWWVLFTHIMVPASTYSWEWLALNSNETVWTDIAEDYDTWLKLTQALKSGDMHMKLMWKLDGEESGDWNEADYFEILSMEIEARYIKYRIYIDDASTQSRVLIGGIPYLRMLHRF